MEKCYKRWRYWARDYRLTLWSDLFGGRYDPVRCYDSVTCTVEVDPLRRWSDWATVRTEIQADVIAAMPLVDDVLPVGFAAALCEELRPMFGRWVQRCQLWQMDAHPVDLPQRLAIWWG